MVFPLRGATVSYERFLALHVILIVPATAGDFFVLVEKLAGRETFWEKGFPPRAPPFQKLLPVSLRKDGKSGLACGPHAKSNGSVGSQKQTFRVSTRK